ncbi:MAG: class I SAM-dependent methyltransferase [Thalassotalea sp.]
MIEHLQLQSLSECQRLFHGRGHAYPGFEHINIDWLAPVVLITLYREVDDAWLLEQAHLLNNHIAECQSVQVQYRCRKMAPTEVLIGAEITHTQVQEHGLKFHIELGKAQNTGLFLDMRNGRQWVAEHSANKKVLNLFSYTCAFSVAALAGNAKQVVNFDLSKSSLSKGRENHRLNEQDLTKVVFQGVDIFKSFSRIKKYGPYDLLICDPPSFQKGSVNIQRDYGKIIRRIPDFMQPNSDLILCLNSPDLDEEFLKQQVELNCPQCHFIDKMPAPVVFKEAHQGKGLKVLHYQYRPMVG